MLYPFKYKWNVAGVYFMFTRWDKIGFTLVPHHEDFRRHSHIASSIDIVKVGEIPFKEGLRFFIKFFFILEMGEWGRDLRDGIAVTGAWGREHGDGSMGTGTWGQERGDGSMGTVAWGREHGDGSMGTGAWGRSVGTGAW